MSKIAVIQHPPVLGDRDATIARAIDLVARAAGAGAKLLVFPEAYVPGYPTYIWRLRPGGDMRLSGEIHDRMVANAVNIAGGHLDSLRNVARKHDVDVLVGCDELDAEFSRATLYNTYVHIARDGAIANVHRKVMPTNPERMVWGLGDGTGIRVVDTPVGR
ncbi:MAG: carbon-nitrogen hydrolase family protein, partial [Deltaproteobacteria bacterium]